MSPRPKLRTKPGAGVVVAMVYHPSSWAIPKGPWSRRKATGGASPRAGSRAPSSESPAPAFTKPRRPITALEGRPQAESYLSPDGKAFDVRDRPLAEDARRSVVGVAVDQEVVEVDEPAPVADEELRVVEGI